MRTCARSALPPPPALRGPSPGSLPLSPPLVTCCPAAQRGAGAAVPSPSRAAPSSPPDSAPPPPPSAALARRGPIGAQGLGGGRDGGAGQGPGERAERRDRGRDERRHAGGGVSAKSGRREGGGSWGCVPAGPRGRGESPSGPWSICSTARAQGARGDPVWGTRAPPQHKGRGSV